jgi:hypothetical protein
MLSRRDWLFVTLSAATTALTARRLSGGIPHTRKIAVYKSPTCGCCQNWVEHMKSKGFVVDAHDVDERQLPGIKDSAGIPAKLRSCHIALADGYAFEGHVPADLVEKVLSTKPKLIGLAVPGMPLGSPGMEVGARKDRYDVVAFGRDGRTWVFAKR